jgi:hypothetical protein
MICQRSLPNLEIPSRQTQCNDAHAPRPTWKYQVIGRKAMTQYTTKAEMPKARLGSGRFLCQWPTKDLKSDQILIWPLVQVSAQNLHQILIWPLVRGQGERADQIRLSHLFQVLQRL